MIFEKDANLLDFNLGAFIHSCNCFHTMGAGIAYQIKQKYPMLFKADVAHGRAGDHTRLGKFSWADLPDGKRGYNLYSQFNLGMEKRQTNYEAMYKGLEAIKMHLTLAPIENVGVPFNMGCKLGGGSWRVVRAILDDIFEQGGINLYICKYEP